MVTREDIVSRHYQHGDLLNAIRNAIAQLGKTTDKVTLDDLAPVDEFHIGGRVATDRFMSQLNISGDDHVLDVGCGLGGAARYVAGTYRSKVTGIDVTPEYIETGNALCEWVRLDQLVTLHHASALDMPFGDESFDAAYMLHVGMNIEDKDRLFSEIHRVLRPGAVFGVYDVMRMKAGDLAYPVPWAADEATSSLADPEHYRRALEATGFELASEANRLEFAREFFEKIRAAAQAGQAKSPLGLHTLMRDGAKEKAENMMQNIAEGLIAPFEIITRRAG